jgi:hypothetical protein
MTPGSNPTHRISAYGFDLDDVSAKIGKDLGRRRAHDDGGQVQNPDATKRTCRRIGVSSPDYFFLTPVGFNHYFPPTDPLSANRLFIIMLLIVMLRYSEA